MRLVLQRFVDTGNSTTGFLTCNNEFICFILEDTHRSEKVAGETRIAQGDYEIAYREELSPDTKKRRTRFSWFKWHLMLKNVHDFKYIYFHEGNTPQDTRGCLLPSLQSNPLNNFGGQSVDAMKKVYDMVCPVLDDGEKVYISVRDEYHLR